MNADLLKAIDVGEVSNLTKAELIELLELTEEAFGSDQDTKFHVYQPVPIALKYHASTAKTRAVFGGNRSSKTYSHIIDYAAQFCGEAPDSLKGIIPEHRLDPRRRLRFCMEDYPNSFEKVVWPYIQQLVPQSYIADTKRDSGRIRSIWNKHGGFIEFMYYDQATTKHQGSSRHSIGYDEEPPEDIRDEGLMRLADVDGEETFSLTPVSGALKYLYDKVYLNRGREVEREYDFITDKNDKLIDVIPGNMRDITFPDGDQDIHVFFTNIFDNPAIKKHVAIRILSKFGKEEMIVRGKGHFMFLSGLVYNMFSDSTHVIDEFSDWHSGPYAGEYTLYIAIDPHPRTPHAVLFLVARRDGMMFVVDEIFKDCTGPILADEIKTKCRGKRPARIIIDPLAYAPDPFTKSCFAWDLMDFGLNDPAPKAASKAKDHGIMETKRILTPKDMGGGRRVPGIYVSRNCTTFRSEIGHYAWDDWKKHLSNTKGEKQKPIDKNDHMMECLYRLILEDPQWIDDDYLRGTVEEPELNYVGDGGVSPVTGY